MANTLIINQPFILEGLNTWTYTVPSGAGGPYSVRVTTTEVPPSGISILVKKNGSTQYTADTLSPTQGGAKFRFGILLAAADVLTVVMASVAAIDNQMNTVKTTVSIMQGF